ncbi:retrovirus-related pol polyprotein from transposon TNT 1-94 [Tanacetum coccineum]
MAIPPQPQVTQNQNVANTVNDPLYISSFDHPDIMLTNTPFNGSNFHGWSRNVKMALGAKLKLGFIDGSCNKPSADNVDEQRWIRCDYMVTCWIFNSMVAELSDAFLYAHSAYELWKEIIERYGQSNGPLIYQLERIKSDNSSKMRECTCAVIEKFVERDSNSKLIQFLMKLSDGYESVRSQILAMDPLPNWYKGKKAKKFIKLAAHVNSSFEEHFHRDTPFDMGNENEVAYGQSGGVDQKLVVADPSTKEIVAVDKGSRCLYICKPITDIAAFSESVFDFTKSHKQSFPTVSFNKTAFSNSVYKQSIDVQTFYARLGHSSVSKLLHIPGCSGHYKKPALNEAHYFFTIVDDHTRATWTYLIHAKSQINVVITSFLTYIETHFQAKPKFIRSDNGTKIVNSECSALFQLKGILHQRSMAYTPQQNDVVERKHMHLLDTTRSIRLYANLPIHFWGDCILAATYLINKMPMKKLQWKSPYEVLYKKPPTFNHVRVIGCLSYATVTRPHKDKFDNRGIKCVLIVSTVQYPLFSSSDFKGIPHSHIAFLENAFVAIDLTSFHQAKTDAG